VVGRRILALPPTLVLRVALALAFDFFAFCIDGVWFCAEGVWVCAEGVWLCAEGVEVCPEGDGDLVPVMSESAAKAGAAKPKIAVVASARANLFICGVSFHGRGEPSFATRRCRLNLASEPSFPNCKFQSKMNPH
jgi:hypothetical protein